MYIKKEKLYLCHLIVEINNKNLCRLLRTCRTAVGLQGGAGFPSSLENNRSLCCTKGWQLQITSRSHLPHEWGCVCIGGAEHNPSLCPLRAASESAPFTTARRWNTLAAVQLKC